MIRQVPELADGGYWVCTLAVLDESGAEVPDLSAGTEYCAWYADVAGGRYAVARTVDPAVVSGVTMPAVEHVLRGVVLPHEVRKPRGRIRGR